MKLPIERNGDHPFSAIKAWRFSIKPPMVFCQTAETLVKIHWHLPPWRFAPWTACTAKRQLISCIVCSVVISFYQWRRIKFIALANSTFLIASLPFSACSAVVVKLVSKLDQLCYFTIIDSILYYSSNWQNY
jgi:hypothetical protein